MFADTQRDGLIASNPFTNLRLETPKGRKDLQALGEAEIQSLAYAAVDALGGEDGPQFRAVLTFLSYVGCRPGELSCIRRDDLDARRAEVVIRSAPDGQGGEKLPKNGRARVVAVPPPAIQALADVPPRLDSPYLFHTSSGKRLSKGTLSHYFRRPPALGRPRQGGAPRAAPRLRDAPHGARAAATRGRESVRAHRRRRGSSRCAGPRIGACAAAFPLPGCRECLMSSRALTRNEGASDARRGIAIRHFRGFEDSG